MPWQGNPRTTTPHHRAWRQLILQRDPICRCQGCKHHHGACAQRSTEADHIIAVSAGGTTTPDNGQGLCQPCHRQKTAHEANLTRWAGTRRTPEAHPGLR